MSKPGAAGSGGAASPDLDVVQSYRGPVALGQPGSSEIEHIRNRATSFCLKHLECS